MRADSRFAGSAHALGDTASPAGVRLRPWRLCYATPDQLDQFAAAAGLTLATRHGGWRDEPFDRDSANHVSVYRRA